MDKFLLASARGAVALRIPLLSARMPGARVSNIKKVKNQQNQCKSHFKNYSYTVMNKFRAEIQYNLMSISSFFTANCRFRELHKKLG